MVKDIYVVTGMYLLFDPFEEDEVETKVFSNFTDADEYAKNEFGKLDYRVNGEVNINEEDGYKAFSIIDEETGDRARVTIVKHCIKL